MSTASIFPFSFIFFFFCLFRSSFAASYPYVKQDDNFLLSLLSPPEISSSSSSSSSPSSGTPPNFSSAIPSSSSFPPHSSPSSTPSKEPKSSSSKNIDKKTSGLRVDSVDPLHAIDASSCLKKGNCSSSSFSSSFSPKDHEERDDSAFSGDVTSDVLVSYRFSGAGGGGGGEEEEANKKFHQEKDPLLYLFRKTDRNDDGLIDSDELLPLLNVIFKKSGKSLHREEEEDDDVSSSSSSSSPFSSFSAATTGREEERETVQRPSKLSPFSSLDRRFSSEILEYFDLDVDGALHEGEFFTLFTNFQSSESYMNTSLYLLFLSHQYEKRVRPARGEEEEERGDLLSFLPSDMSSSFSLFNEGASMGDAASSSSTKRNRDRRQGRRSEEEEEEEFIVDLLQGFFPTLSLSPEKRDHHLHEEEEELARVSQHEQEDPRRRVRKEEEAFRSSHRRSRRNRPSIYRSKMSYKAIHTAIREIHEEQISLLKMEISHALRAHLPFLSEISLYRLFHDSQRHLFLDLLVPSSSSSSSTEDLSISLAPGAEERVRQILFPSSSPLKAGEHRERKENPKTTPQEEEEGEKLNKAERKKEEDVVISVVLSKMKEVELFRRLLDIDMDGRLHACDLDDDAFFDLNEVAFLLEKEDLHINSSLLFSFFDKDSDRSLSIEETRNLAATITSWSIIDGASGQPIQQGTGYLPNTGEKNVYYHQEKKKKTKPRMSPEKGEMKDRQEQEEKKRRKEEEQQHVCAFCWIVDSNKDRVVDFEEFKFFLQNENLTSVLTHHLLKKNRDIIQM
ncbi:ef hand domain-containing protein [Cystoisospora suis]|uniref:Ef hand domain-containing protein n=1 Tax=Cystoisospora suis TaxID=483139 RepID=A0A2C6LD85_9APIC|nr:ef hand domain-containing protein [Cystoisospora suis]